MYNKKVLSNAVKNLDRTKAPAKKQDMIVDPMGQWKYPGQNTRIPSNDITMQGVPYPVWAVPNVGTPQMMYPEQNYYFPGADHVDEYPQMQKGGSRQPIYVTDPNDPRLLAYKDRLSAYNKTQNVLRALDNLPMSDYSTEDFHNKHKAYTIADDELFEFLDTHSNIEPSSWKDTNKYLGLPPGAQSFSLREGIPVFEKPVQSVIYQPEIKLPTKKLPQETEIIPNNYNYIPQKYEPIQVANRSQTIMEPDPDREGKYRVKELRQVPYSAYFPGEGWQPANAPRVLYIDSKGNEVEERPKELKQLDLKGETFAEGGDISIPDLNQYEDGGEYDLTQEEIDDLIAQGYQVEDVDTDEYKKGGTPRSLPKKKSSKAYSRSLTATNKLFAQSSLTRSRKKKIFDPNAKYYQDGGELPEDYSEFESFAQTLPSNLQDPAFEYGNPDQYNLYGLWETVGKPQSFQDVQDSDYFPLQDDGSYHGFTVGSDGEFLKPMSHSTTWKEVMNSELNTDPYFKENRLIKNEQGRLQYVPNKQKGGVNSPVQLTSYYSFDQSESPEAWATEIKNLERQIGNPVQWTNEDYALMQNKLNDYQTWRKQHPEVRDLSNKPNEYVVPLPYHLRKKQKGGFHTDINKRRQVLRDWVYGADIGMLQEPDGGYMDLELNDEEIQAYRDGGYVVEDISVPELTQAQKGLITYKDNVDLINSTANFDMISKVPVSQQYNEQIKHRLYTGNYGYDPQTGELVKLKASDKGTLSKEDQKMLNIQEKKKIQEESKDIIEQQKSEHINSIINAGYDPATFAGGYLPNSPEYKDMFTPGMRSNEELQKVPVEKWTKDEKDAWLNQGYYSTMFNPAFQLAALATPVGAAVGIMNAIANVPLDLYNKDYSTAALNALELIPIAKPFTKALGKGAKTIGTQMSNTADKVLPQYKNVYRVEPTTFAKDAADDLSGRWYGSNPEELKFYVNNLKDQDAGIRIMRSKIPVKKWESLSGMNMPEKAKQMSAGKGVYKSFTDAAEAGQLSQGAAKRLTKGVHIDSDINELFNNPSLINLSEGILPEAKAMKIRTSTPGKFSRYERVEFPGGDLGKQGSKDYLENVHSMVEKPILGIPRKYIPFQEGGEADYEDLELTPEEIDWYLTNGYDLEMLP